jgi:hypothetical protein
MTNVRPEKLEAERWILNFFKENCAKIPAGTIKRGDKLDFIV